MQKITTNLTPDDLELLAESEMLNGESPIKTAAVGGDNITQRRKTIVTKELS